MIADKPRRSEWASAARQILRQYNEGAYREEKFLGPHYVAYDRGEFILQPFGAFAKHRYSFECRPEVVSWQDEPLWTFQVRA